ncbi:hypothetical protein PO909_027206, partial [Leuciscus waleckii]
MAKYFALGPLVLVLCLALCSADSNTTTTTNQMQTIPQPTPQPAPAVSTDPVTGSNVTLTNSSDPPASIPEGNADMHLIL